jgi:hypothetical protein
VKDVASTQPSTLQLVFLDTVVPIQPGDAMACRGFHFAITDAEAESLRAADGDDELERIVQEEIEEGGTRTTSSRPTRPGTLFTDACPTGP